MNNWNRIWKPIVVLSLICVVVTGALAATNEVTAPIIEEATIAAENAARAEVLPEADSFSPVEGITVEGVSAVYTADNGAGAAITASAKGYGGDVVPSPSRPRPRVSAATWWTTPSIWPSTAACPPPSLWCSTRTWTPVPAPPSPALRSSMR